MKNQFIYLFLLFSISFNIPLRLNEDISSPYYIVFMNKMIKVPDDGPTINGTAIVIEKPGIYYVSGQSEEGNIVIKSSSVSLYLQNLNLTSYKTAPIIVTSKSQDVQIINLQDTELNDFEDSSTTTGECAVIKILKKCSVSFKNLGTFKLNGKCKNVIKGLKQTSITFEKSEGEYIINAQKNGISSEHLLEFNTGTYTISTEEGDGIICSPDEDDTVSLGKILINDGTFNLHTYHDAFTAANNIIIFKGNFDIKTENGYDTTTYDENKSYKGFKLTNNQTGCEIKIYSGTFSFNTADDAFHSKGDIKILSGNYVIKSKDDGISTKQNLVLGEKNAPKENLNIEILNSYEALEGMTITIYSGKIICTATDDGINSAGESSGFGPGPGGRNHSQRDPFGNDTDRPHRRNHSEEGSGSEGRRPPSMRGNASYYVSLYDAEVYIYCDGDGIDSNGNIFVHGGQLNVFSQGNRDNEPIDHDGNFTLFNGEVLGVGSKGMKQIHAGIKKGNQLYAFHYGAITKNKYLEILNENNELVKEGKITKDINYIFYSSPKLNENYVVYITDESTNTRSKLDVTFGTPESGEDDDDINYIK